MIKRFICLLTAIITMSIASNGATPKDIVPDFSKPAQQSREELKKLAEALADGDSKEAARSAILYDALLAARDGDSLQVAIDTINSVASDKRVGAPVRALLNLYAASIYGDVYTQDRWVYDNRQQPLEPIPADCKLWSGEQFKQVILSYIDKALSESPELKKAPMAEYGRICGLQDKKNLIFYPTLYDFAAYKSIEILKNIQAGHFLFSFGLLTPHDVYVKEKFTYQSPLNKRILELYQSLIEFHHDDAAPMIWADVNRIKFIASHLSDFGYDEGQSDDEAEYHDPLSGKSKPAPAPKTFRLLIDLYKQWHNSPYAAEALLAAGDYIGFTNDPADLKYYCGLVGKQLAAYPSYRSNGCLENKVADLTHRHVFISLPSTVVPGATAKISITGYNTREFDLKVYKVPYSWTGDNYYRMRSGTQRTLVKTVRIKTSGTVPFCAEMDTTITFDKLGAYIVVPTFTDGTENEMGNSYSFVHCTNLALQSMTYGQERWAMVVNPKTGAPVDKAAVSRMNSNSRSWTVAETYISDSEGVVKLTDKGGQYYAKKGNDSFASPIYSSWYPQYDKERVYRVCPLTDLAIYHPGDTVGWNIVSQSYLRGRARVEPSLKVRAILHNANYERIDTVEVTTDDWGRAEGSFVLPKEGLTGQFSIEFRLLDQEKSTRNMAGNVYFTVSDYKLPTYYVEVTDIVRDAPDKGGVTLKGRAMTYSGFPVSSASVDLNLKSSYRSPWWRNGVNGGNSFYSTDVMTDDKGDFTIELPEALLKQSPVSDPIFYAELTAVSSTGESQSTSASFTQGRPYLINSTLPGIINTSAPVNLAVTMSDLSGKNITADVRYVIRGGDNREVASGVVSTANPTADLSGVPSGRYTFIFTPVDKTLASRFVTTSHVLYKPSDKRCPLTDVALWVPEKNVKLTGTRRASVLLGVTGAESHVRYAVYTDSVLLKQGWIKYPAGMHRFEYDMPEGVDDVTLTLSCTSDYRNSQENVKISLAEADKSIKLSVESFRDRLTPGDNETWTFRVTDAAGRGIQAPVALDMYAKSLDNLATRRFSISPVSGQPMRYNINVTDFRRLNEILSSSYRAKPCTVIGLPEFFISMPPFYGVGRNVREHRIMVRGLARTYNSAATADMKMAKAESAEMEDAVAEESMSFASMDSASPAMGADAGATETTDDMDGGENGTDNFEYRLPETPLAFFRPTLTTDADGTLNFTFTVPNANTTWKLCAYTYNRDMEVADLTREAIASKPVMVQPNLPRFLRNGDRACVQSSVMNNTDSAQTIVSTVEIFDPASGKVIATETYEDSIAALMSAKISTWIEAPLDGNMIGYRVKSSVGRFSDGEQAIIPVLSAIEPVIETTPFYLSADTKEFSMKLPKMPKDARVTLQFCENPTWYVVTALPGIRDSKANDALSASAAIFSAAIADGVLRTDPAIAEAVRMWNSSDKSDSTLVSMLQRNSDLKTILLSSTPWVMDAQSQTERMERLALLFDAENINRTYSESVKKLESLACADGGWAWIEQYKQPSMWVTENILAMMGRLKRLGYLPDNKELKSMLDKAVGYYDAETEKVYRKDPKYTSPLFVLVRGYYPEQKMSATIKNFVSNTLGVESREWKRRGIPAKAIDAMILNDNNYPTAAKEIIASLRDFAVTKPERGMWWPSLDDMTVWSMGKISATSLVLDAFVNVVSGSADIDLIRQWLILQKEAKDWGTSVSTSDAVASILLSGSKWTRPAQGAVVRIGGKQIQPVAVDSLLGYFREDISQYKPSSAKLTVEKSGDTPSWGAVYTQYRDRMTDIKAASCPDLSIDKVLYRRVNSDEGVKWESVDELKVGDLIQVNITIIANRDMDYVAVIDDRGACLEPVEQLPAPIYSEGICFYRENRDSYTNMFITHLPKGTYRLSYEMYVNNAGTFSAGIASAQSQYAPALSAHSSGTTLTVGE